jgi:MFS family permease
MPILGVGVGFAFAAMATLIAEAVRPTETGVATGMNTVMRTVGGVVGGQMGAALLSAYTISGTGVPSATGFELTFGIGAAVALLGASSAVFVTRRSAQTRPDSRGTRRDLRGTRKRPRSREKPADD